MLHYWCYCNLLDFRLQQQQQKRAAAALAAATAAAANAANTATDDNAAAAAAAAAEFDPFAIGLYDEPRRSSRIKTLPVQVTTTSHSNSSSNDKSLSQVSQCNASACRHYYISIDA
jgi:hypothetical protein